MIAIENTSTTGWEAAVRGMRNPMNSHHKMDSHYDNMNNYILGENDLKLAKQLASAGRDHAKYLRMIVVYADITAPLYWLKEMDQYKVGTVSNSASTMHKISAKQFTLDNFSCEHLTDESRDILESVIKQLNKSRDAYNFSKDKNEWWQMIQLLPSSYNQKRTYMLNYEVLHNIYFARRNHKLDEWHDFCAWVEQLPYSELITS